MEVEEVEQGKKTSISARMCVKSNRLIIVKRFHFAETHFVVLFHLMKVLPQ